MYYGFCVNSTFARHEELTRENSTHNATYAENPRTSTVSIVHTGTKPNTYPCSHLSTAPTTTPTTTPTTAPTAAPDYPLIAGLTVGGALLLVAAVAAGVFWWCRRQQRKREPWRKAMYKSAKAKCDDDSEWAHECVASEVRSIHCKPHALRGFPLVDLHEVRDT